MLQFAHKSLIITGVLSFAHMLFMVFSVMEGVIKLCLMGSRGGAVVRALASTNVSRVRFLDPASYVGQVCCCFSPAQRVFLQVLRFSSLLKNQHFYIPI